MRLARKRVHLVRGRSKRTECPYAETSAKGKCQVKSSDELRDLLVGKTIAGIETDVRFAVEELKNYTDVTTVLTMTDGTKLMVTMYD